MVHSAAQNLGMFITALHLWHLVLHTLIVSLHTAHFVPRFTRRLSQLYHRARNAFYEGAGKARLQAMLRKQLGFIACHYYSNHNVHHGSRLL